MEKICSYELLCTCYGLEERTGKYEAGKKTRISIVVQVDPHHSIISRVMNDGVDTVLLASSGTTMLRILPNHLPAQCAVVNLACPAEDMVVVPHLLKPENAVFSSPIID